MSEVVKTVSGKLYINEMYFDINKIRFVNIVPQEFPIFRKICMANGILGVLSLPFLASFDLWYISVTYSILFFFLVFLIRRQYALRIGTEFGVTKVLITDDKKRLDRMKRTIQEYLSEKQPC